MRLKLKHITYNLVSRIKQHRWLDRRQALRFTYGPMWPPLWLLRDKAQHMDTHCGGSVNSICKRVVMHWGEAKVVILVAKGRGCRVRLPAHPIAEGGLRVALAQTRN